jgi:NitT/TauT family transport system permease protein
MERAVHNQVEQQPRQNIVNRLDFLDKKTPIYAPILGILGILIIWETFSQLEIVSSLYLPAPSTILAMGWGMLTTGEIHTNLWASLIRLAAGFMIGASLGIVVGLVLGFFRWLDAMFIPVVYSIFPIPKIALLPLFIMWLGVGETPKVTLIAIGVFFPILINTYTGVKNVDPSLIKAAVTFGAKPFNVIRKVILPGSLPMIFAGLKVAASISLLLLVAAEMIAALNGVGAMILRYGNLMMTTNLMVGVLILSLLGLLFNRLLEWAERKLLPWK